MTDDEEDEKKFRMMPLGDILMLVLMVICLVGLAWFIFAPSTYKMVFEKDKSAPPAEVTVAVPENGAK
jgi:hypothetical protein